MAPKLSSDEPKMLHRYNCSNILENPDKAKAALEATIAAMHDMPRKYADGWQ